MHGLPHQGHGAYFAAQEGALRLVSPVRTDFAQACPDSAIQDNRNLEVRFPLAETALPTLFGFNRADFTPVRKSLAIRAGYPLILHYRNNIAAHQVSGGGRACCEVAERSYGVNG